MERFYSIGALSQSMGRPKKGNNVSNVLGIIEDGALEFQDLCEEYFVYPWFMLLLFVVSGMSASYLHQ